MENKNKPIPVRMDAPLRKRVRSAGRKIGLSNSAIIRLGVLAILPQIESGLIKVPRDVA